MQLLASRRVNNKCISATTAASLTFLLLQTVSCPSVSGPNPQQLLPHRHSHTRPPLPPSSAVHFSTTTPTMSVSKSAQSLIPSDPAKVMVIRDVTPQITTFSTPFLRFSRIKIGGRGTLVKLASGNLAIISPVALTDDVRATISAKGGSLKYIVAPDIEHHIFVTPWARAFPDAEVIGVEGLPEKRESDPATKGVKFHHVYSASNQRDLKVSDEFDREFAAEFVHAHQNKELALLHRPSRTLIEADLLFNLPATEQFSKSGQAATSGLLTKLFGAIMNTRGDATWQKRALWYGAAGKDRLAFKESAARISAWDFDRIVPCHGDVIETGGKAKWDNLVSWFKDAKK